MGCSVLMRARLWRFISGVGGEAGPLIAGMHICQLARLEHPYIVGLLAGPLIAGPHIRRLACLEHCIYCRAVGWTTPSGPTYTSAGTLGVQYIYPYWLGPLLAVAHICLAGMLGAPIYFIPVVWTTHSGHAYMSAGMLGAPIYCRAVGCDHS